MSLIILVQSGLKENVKKTDCLLASLDGTDGIELKRLVPLLEQWHETVNGEYATRNIEIIINVREEDR